MKVARLPVDPGPSGWAEILPEADAPTPLEEHKTSDWLVIGAGFAGLAATRRLSQLRPEDRITLLDAARVGEGPAGRNSGFMIDLPHDLTSDDYAGTLDADADQIADNRRAIAFAAEMAEAFGLPQEAFDPAGKVNGAATAKGHRHNLDYAKHLERLGEPYDLLNAADMQDLTGTSYYEAGLFTPGSVMLQPAMFVRGVAAGLRSNRVQIHEQSPVTELARIGNSWRATTPKGAVTAPRVILAVNGHLESFGHLTGRLVHVHTYASMTQPLTPEQVRRLGGAARWHLTPADPLGTTVRRVSGTGGARLIIRNRFTFDPKLEAARGWDAQIQRDHDAAFAARFPMLRGVEMAYRWGGRLCLSRNAVQVVGELEHGLYAACCQNGLGTAKGTLAGLLAAELACGKTSPALERAVSAPQPSRLPPTPLAQIGASARLRWGEWRAGREK